MEVRSTTQGRSEGELVLYAIALTLSWTAVFARIYVRAFLVRAIGADDYFLIVSLLLFTAIIGIATYTATVTLGQSGFVAPDVRDTTLMMVLDAFYKLEILYFASIVSLKLSIMILLLRFTLRPLYRWIIISTGVICALFGLATMFVATFQCWPVARYWDESIPGTCIKPYDFAVLIYCNAAISLVSDAVFSILPAFMVWHIQMDQKTKTSLMIVLSLGFTTSGVNIARFFYISALSSRVYDISRLFPISTTSVVEITIGIMAASMATMRPFLRKLSSTVSVIPLHIPRLRRSTLTPDVRAAIEEIEKPRGRLPSDATGSTMPIHDDAPEWCAILKLANLRAGVEAETYRHDLELALPRLEAYHFHVSEKMDLPDIGE